MTYYAVIGGWITKYAVVYITGQAQAAATDDYFTSFITSSTSPVIFALLFMGVTALIVYNGVEKGIEKVSKWMMPILLILVVIIAVYSLTLRHTDTSGQVHTGLQGFLYYLTPDLQTYRAAFSADSAGCHEPAVFLAQCVHGNHDHLRFLRQARGKFKQSRQPD